MSQLTGDDRNLSCTDGLPEGIKHGPVWTYPFDAVNEAIRIQVNATTCWQH